MTGFGKAEANIQNKLIQIEIRSLNSRGFDANIRMPNFLRDRELMTRNILSDELKRGKIDVFFNVELPDTLKAQTINQNMAITYAEQLQELAHRLNVLPEDLLSLVIQMPNVMEVPQEEISDEEWNEIEKLLYEATSRIMDYREKEGDKTEDELRSALDIIQQQLDLIPQFEDERTEAVRERISRHIEEYVNIADIDQNRLEQELIYYIEKYDISEEKMRLKAHLEHFIDLLDEQEISKGKQLNFVCQEIGREINTIGSKANHVNIQKLVIIMKDYLEQIKEQLANVL